MPGDGAQQGFAALRLGPRAERVVGGRPVHPVRRLLPVAARVEEHVPLLAPADERPLERVPVVDAAVHRPLPPEDLPVAGRRQHRRGAAAEPRHPVEHVDREHGADPRALEHVPGVEQVPGAVDVPERVRVDREPLAGRQVDPAVDVRSHRVVGDCHAQRVGGVAPPHGVVHPPAAVVVCDLGRPVVAAEPFAEVGRQRLERAARGLPPHQVGGAQHLEGAPVDAAPGADRDVPAAVDGQDEGIGEVAGVDGIAVRPAHA